MLKTREETIAGGNNKTIRSVGDAIQLLRNQFARERGLYRSGLVGLGLGLTGLVVRFIHGPVIEPEGVLQKAISFDLALGIYILTIALFVPFMGFPERGLRHWRGWLISLTYLAYGIENVQIARGLDPRFSTHGSPTDNMVGGIFFLIATGVAVTFLIMVIGIFKNRNTVQNTLVMTAARYAFAATLLAFGAGFWISFAGGPFNGEANILFLHAIGFHGLQAVPAVALFLTWAEANHGEARRSVNLAGMLWLGACVTITVQTTLGQPIFAVSAFPLLTAAFVAAWAVIAARSAMLWLNKPARVQSAKA